MQFKDLYRFLSLLAVALVAASSSAAEQRFPDNAEHHVSEKQDAYHFKFWQGSPYNAAYTEWWYFNLYDAKDDIQAIFTYQVADPLNLTGQGGGQMTSVVYQGHKTIAEGDFFPLTLFSASYSAANVSVGSNTISVAGPRTYVVNGASVDGRLAWNLYYDRESSPWFGVNHKNVAPLPWEQMSWLIAMPRAAVHGTLTIDGYTYQIDCSGYHDHNWGEWDFSTVVWNWAQYSQPNLSFDLGDFVGNPNGRASIAIDGRRIEFPADQYRLVHTKWAFDKQNNVSYPVESLFTADTEEMQVRVVMRVQKTEPLTSGPPPSLVIYEQPCHFSGTVTMRNEWAPIDIPFEGNGFKEYTATTSVAP